MPFAILVIPLNCVWCAVFIPSVFWVSGNIVGEFKVMDQALWQTMYYSRTLTMYVISYCFTNNPSLKRKSFFPEKGLSISEFSSLRVVSSIALCCLKTCDFFNSIFFSHNGHFGNDGLVLSSTVLLNVALPCMYEFFSLV